MKFSNRIIVLDFTVSFTIYLNFKFKSSNATDAKLCCSITFTLENIFVFSALSFYAMCKLDFVDFACKI